MEKDDSYDVIKDALKQFNKAKEREKNKGPQAHEDILAFFLAKSYWEGYFTGQYGHTPQKGEIEEYAMNTWRNWIPIVTHIRSIVMEKPLWEDG